MDPGLFDWRITGLGVNEYEVCLNLGDAPIPLGNTALAPGIGGRPMICVLVITLGVLIPCDKFPGRGGGFPLGVCPLGVIIGVFILCNALFIPIGRGEGILGVLLGKLLGLTIDVLGGRGVFILGVICC